MTTPNDEAGTATDKKPDLLELARQKFNDPKDPLTKTEEEFLRKIANGDHYWKGPALEQIDPAKAEEWGEDRVLNADRIVWLCTDPKASALVTHQGVAVVGARINGRLDLKFAKISFPLLFWRSAFPEGINLVRAEIRALYLPGTYSGPIKADGLRVDGNVFLRDGFQAKGEVCLLGAEINGNLDCDGGCFLNEKGKALSADRLNVKGSVFLREGFYAEGEVRLLGATINGDLDCTNGKFINKDKNAYALHADRLNVKGNVFLCKGFYADGEVCLVGATIGGYFSWTKVASPEKIILDLRSAKIGTLYDDPDSWPEKDKLLLNGLVYGEIADYTLIDAQTRIDWLHLQPEDDFRPQPYEQLASVLRKAGHDEDAKKILIQKNKDRARYAKMGRFERLRHWLLGLTIGYGYRPWRPFWGMLGFIALGWLFFWLGFQAELITPTKEGDFSKQSEIGRGLPGDYPKFNALVYSIDMFVPLVDLHQARYWLPNAKNKPEPSEKGKFILCSGGVLCCYMWIHIIAGWVLSTLFIVGLTGLVRKLE